MSEASENLSESAKLRATAKRRATSAERKFARTKGLVPAGTNLRASRAAWTAATKNAPIQRISGVDVGRAKGNVNKARAKVAKSGYTYYNKPAGGTKPAGAKVGKLRAAKYRATGLTQAQRDANKQSRLKAMGR